jgi:RNA polymerase sigma factor (sigma-70 family)
MVVQREMPGSAEASDAVLIERSLSEPAVFGAIFDRHFDAVYAYLARRAGRGLADDLVSSTFTLAFERRHRFRADAQTARPWLFGIATNLLRNHRRTEKRALRALGSLDVPVPSDFSEPSNLPRLGGLLAGLDRDQRDVLLLHAWEELSYEEIAHALGVPIGTVRSRLARARARLKKALDEDRELGAQTSEVTG